MPLASEMQQSLDFSLLPLLGAATKKDDELVSFLGQVYAISRTCRWRIAIEIPARAQTLANC